MNRSDNGQQVRKVVIAGGGTAGWIAAAALSTQLGPLLDITLVESEQIGTVGVGEATIPTHRTFHALLGIDERDFMRATQATFKLGIAFENWARKGDRYIHSFGQVGKGTWMGDFQHMWLQAKAEGVAGDFSDYCFELQAAEAGKFYTSDKNPLSFAYHLDATRYAAFMRRLAEAKGVTRREGKITQVQQNPESGFIDAIGLDSGETIEGDLFIDCTGFRGLLIEDTLETGFDDWSHWLPTDSAIAVQTEAVGPPLPYTRAIAHEAGWQWRIPLQHRVGNGLVYCSDYLSEDDARALIGANIQGETITEPRLIRYRTGSRREVWNRNCIALGLSSGFVEPLESTSIHLIQIGVTRLIKQFPFGGVTDVGRRHYNDTARKELERIRDFIILHYYLTEREEPFWRARQEMHIPDTLAHQLELFRETGIAWQAPEDLFRVYSWLQVMLGQRLEPRGHHLMGKLMSRDQMGRALASLKGKIDNAVERLPSHQDFISTYCAAEKP